MRFSYEVRTLFTKVKGYMWLLKGVYIPTSTTSKECPVVKNLILSPAFTVLPVAILGVNVGAAA